MKQRWIIALLCLCMLAASPAGAVEGAYLPGDVLRTLEPTFEAFVTQLADVLVERDLLQASQKEEWILYQLGDFVQNGGFGSIIVLYTPGLLGIADESVTIRRFTLETEAGTLLLETLRQYEEQYSPLPGLPLDVKLLDENGEPVDARFRWTATGGDFLVWDDTREQVNEANSYVGDVSVPVYWYEEPYGGIEETLTLEVLTSGEDSILATATLLVRSGEESWTTEGFR